MFTQNVFDFITTEENNYKTNRIAITEGWDWNMYEHINLSTLYKNSTYKTGKNDDKPFKNITRPLLNLQYRTEGFDVKDIMLFIDDAYEYYKSLLIKKFHDKWARENKIDTFIDEVVESFIDYGGALAKDVNDVRPELVPLQRLAFCDQTDILGGAICEKHFYSVNQLRDMVKQGWDSSAVEDVITFSEPFKDSQTQGNKKNKTPSKYIEVYELHGTLPDWWLEDENESAEAKDNELVGQIQIITYYKDAKDTKHGVTLFSGKEKELPYKFIARDKIFGRALGLGGAEELFEPQVWTNYDVLRIKGMLDEAAKVLFQTTDEAFANRNKTTDLDNGEIMVVAEGKTITQVNTTPQNITIFERSLTEWDAHAKEMAGATDALMGTGATSGVPFRLQALITQQALSLHQYRQGKLAIFMEEIYRDWILPHIVREIVKGTTFLAELSMEELQSVAESLVACKANDMIKEKILNGETIDPNEVEMFKQQVRQDFMKGGNKKFMEILKSEMKDAPIDIEIVIANKQKDLTAHTDSLSNIFRTVFANPAILQDPTMAKLLNQIMVYSGLEPIDVSAVKPQPQLSPPQTQLPQPNQPVANNQLQPA